MTHPEYTQAQVDEAIAAAQAGPGYETKDTNIWGVIYFLIGLFVTLFVVQVGVWYMLKETMSENGVVTIPASDAAPPAAFQYPMTSALLEQLNRLRESEDSTLNGYGWVSEGEKKGDDRPVRIPVAQAIDLLAERGFKPFDGKPQTESMVNSHSGVAQPMDDKGKLLPDEKVKPDGGAKP